MLAGVAAKCVLGVRPDLDNLQRPAFLALVANERLAVLSAIADLDPELLAGRRKKRGLGLPLGFVAATSPITCHGILRNKKASGVDGSPVYGDTPRTLERSVCLVHRIGLPTLLSPCCGFTSSAAKCTHPKSGPVINPASQTKSRVQITSAGNAFGTSFILGCSQSRVISGGRVRPHHLQFLHVPMFIPAVESIGHKASCRPARTDREELGGRFPRATSRPCDSRIHRARDSGF